MDMALCDLKRLVQYRGRPKGAPVMSEATSMHPASHDVTDRKVLLAEAEVLSIARQVFEGLGVSVRMLLYGHDSFGH